MNTISDEQPTVDASKISETYQFRMILDMHSVGQVDQFGRQGENAIGDMAFQ